MKVSEILNETVSRETFETQVERLCEKILDVDAPTRVKLVLNFYQRAFKLKLPPDYIKWLGEVGVTDEALGTLTTELHKTALRVFDIWNVIDLPNPNAQVSICNISDGKGNFKLSIQYGNDIIEQHEFYDWLFLDDQIKISSLEEWKAIEEESDYVDFDSSRVQMQLSMFNAKLEQVTNPVMILWGFDGNNILTVFERK